MWGFGGNYYWGRKERRRQGIVVVFAWMSSDERHLKQVVDFYASLGWDSLVCHTEFLNSLFPDKATLLAWDVLSELVEEIKIRPCPIVFAAFSGGSKACMFKVLQIIEGRCEVRSDVDYFRCIRDCVAGHIYDSSPVDFTSDMVMRFILHPSILNKRRPPRLVTWIASGISSGLDTLFFNRFESQRAEHWQTLYSSVNMNAPYLLLCSEDDDLASVKTICNFAQRIEDLGADVTLVKWVSSPHLGHLQQHPDDYKAAVTHLLQKASALYTQRIQRQLVGEKLTCGAEGPNGNLSGPSGFLRQMAVSPAEIFRRASAELADHFTTPTSSQHHDGRTMDSSGQDQSTGNAIHIPSTPSSINPNGVLGQILFDICVPKNVEDWDIKPSSLLRSPPMFPAPRRNSPFNPIKLIRRSRL